MDPNPENNKRNTPQVAAGILFAIFLTIAFVSGCSTPAKQKWLTFFFDGVPMPGTQTNQVTIQYDEDGRPLATVVAPQINLTPAVVPVFYAHAPYENRECNECHKSKYSPELKAPEKDLCFACHEDFLAAAKFKHSPAENGECISCHDPHGSSFPGMIKLVGNATCFECHEEKDMEVVDAHKNAQEKICLVCHNPHVGDDEFLLRTVAAKPPPQPTTAK